MYQEPERHRKIKKKHSKQPLEARISLRKWRDPTKNFVENLISIERAQSKENSKPFLQGKIHGTKCIERVKGGEVVQGTERTKQ